MSKFHDAHHMHVENVALKVKNLKKSLSFYENIIGLNLLSEENGKAVLGIESPIVTLIEDINATFKTATTGLYHFAILLPTREDLSLYLKHLINVRYPITGGSDHGVSEALYFNDPDGNGIEIYRDKEESEWPRENGNITMYTEFLDYEELLSITPNTKFSKMPKGTILGHLHLHVRNLDEAKKFFVDTVGFQVVLKYGPSALFISDNGYHHHIGLNTWAGTNVPNRTTQTGLVSYQVLSTKEKFMAIKDSLDIHNIPYKFKENTLFFNDVNDTLIELVHN